MRESCNVSNTHFRKNWQSYVKTWFDQPSQKKKRRRVRLCKKKILLSKNSTDTKLRPLIHCPTFMHNMKVRFGRGFSLVEIKKAKVTKNHSNSISISVDKRRKNRNYSQVSNIKRLNEYLSKILLIKKKKNTFTDNKEKENVTLKKKCFAKNSFRKYSIKQSFI